MTCSHVAPVVVIPHRVGPSAWSTATRRLARFTDENPNMPLTVRLPGAGVEHLRLTEPELLAALIDAEIDWLAGGWSDPVLTDLPQTAAQAQIDREATAMSAAGIVPAGLWFGDAWEPRLVEFSVENGFALVFVDESVLTDTPYRPLVVESAGTVVTVIGVGTRRESFGPGKHQVDDQARGDGLVGLGVDVAELDDLVACGPRLIRPVDYLSSHRHLTVKTRIASGVPARRPETEIFYRKVLRVTNDQRDRKSALDSILRLQSREFVADGVPTADSHVDLIEARKQVDRLNHRGDSWVMVEESDWDADGADEIVIETAQASLVLDPHQGTMPVWDDKIANWAVTSVSPGAPMVLVRRMTDDNTELEAEPMVTDEISQGRSEVTVRLHSETLLSCQVRLVERSVELELTVADVPDEIRIGPEIPLSLIPASTEIRVDGSEWGPLVNPAGFTGHRFRLRDGVRTVLISAPRPAQLFVRPLPDHGVVVWPHWTTTGATTYQVAVTPD